MAKTRVIKRLRVLVCGDREWTDRAFIYDELDKLADVAETIIVIHGAARGADTIGAEWAESRLVRALSYPALWNDFSHPLTLIKYRRDGSKYNAMAGPIRNQQMLDEGKPDLVMAFHDDLSISRGTRDMVNRAKKAGIETKVFSHDRVRGQHARSVRTYDHVSHDSRHRGRAAPHGQSNRRKA